MNIAFLQDCCVINRMQISCQYAVSFAYIHYSVWYIGYTQNLPTFLLLYIPLLNFLLRILTYSASLCFLFNIFKFPIGVHLFTGGDGKIDKFSVVFILEMAAGLHRGFKCIFNILLLTLDTMYINGCYGGTYLYDCVICDIFAGSYVH